MSDTVDSACSEPAGLKFVHSGACISLFPEKQIFWRDRVDGQDDSSLGLRVFGLVCNLRVAGKLEQSSAVKSRGADAPCASFSRSFGFSAVSPTKVASVFRRRKTCRISLGEMDQR